MIDCEELKKVIGNFKCCDGCHSDFDAKGFTATFNGKNYQTCCKGLTAAKRFKAVQEG